MILLLLLAAIWFVSSVLVITFYKVTGKWDNVYDRDEMGFVAILGPVGILCAGIYYAWIGLVKAVAKLSDLLAAWLTRKTKSVTETEDARKSASPDPSSDQSSSVGKVVMDK